MAGNDLFAAALMSGLHRQQGVVLVLVLWVVVLLTVIAGAVTMTRNTGISMVTNMRGQYEGRALLEAGFRFMMLNLSANPGGQTVLRGGQQQLQWPADGRLHRWDFAGREVWVGAVPEAARIDLNTAEADLLRDLFISKGVALEDAQALADAILDWRDKDKMRRTNGIEDPGYRAQGRVIGARDDKFQSVQELRQVFGMTPELYRAVESSLTVDSGQSTVNPIFASKEVLAALPGMTALEIENYIQQRDEARLNGLPVPMPAGVDKRFVNAGKAVRYRLYAEVTVDGFVLQGEAVIRVDKPLAGGFEILAKSFAPDTMPGKFLPLEEL